MKANTPEKIYVQLPSRDWIGRTWNETPIKEGDNPNWKNATNIEYTRTDAFIEKAAKWLDENAARFSTESTMEIEYFVDVFKKEIRSYVYGKI